MKDLIIVGAGGFGREVAWLVERINKVKPTWNLLGFLDDNDCVVNKEFNGNKVLGKIDDASNFSDAHFVCAIASTKIRSSIVNNRLSNCKFATLIDPSVEMSNYVEIGEGSIISAHVIMSTNIKIGKHVFIDYDCTIGHDAVLSDFVTLFPSVNVSGFTFYGEGVTLGVGSQIIQSVKIGENTFIGAGAVVVKDIPSNCTAVGVPAKAIKFN